MPFTGNVAALLFPGTDGIICWFAPESLKIGDHFRAKIDEAIRTHEKLLLILASASIESGWVEYKVERAHGRERKSGETMLFPVRPDDAIFGVVVGHRGVIPTSWTVAGKPCPLAVIVAPGIADSSLPRPTSKADEALPGAVISQRGKSPWRGASTGEATLRLPIPGPQIR